MRYILSILTILCICSSVSNADKIAFIAHPRVENGGLFKTSSLAETDGPHVFKADADLIIRDLSDNTETVVVENGVVDYSVAYNDANILYVTQVTNNQADIYRVDIQNNTNTRLTNQAGWQCQPILCPDGIIYLSDEDNWQNPHESYKAFTIYKMDFDGSNKRRIWHAGLGGVFGLYLGPNGRIYFSSGENQGHRGGRGNFWSIWSINPDGSDFAPEMTATALEKGPWDFPVITSAGALAVSRYYDTRVYGTIHIAPKFESSPFGPPTMFGSPLRQENTPVANGSAPKKADGSPGNQQYYRFEWQRRGLYNLIPDSHDGDIQCKNKYSQINGIFSHPWPIPGNGLYVTWTNSKGDANSDLGVYVVPDITDVVDPFTELVKVVDEPTRHEWHGKRLVTYTDIYGYNPPTPKGLVSDELPEGSPFGVIGTSSIDVNEWVRTVYRTNTVRIIPAPDEVEWVRILGFSPTRTVKILNVPKYDTGSFSPVVNSSNYEGFTSHINERTVSYEELIPVKKYQDGNGNIHLGPNPPEGYTRIMRSDGMTDSSWKAVIPANQPWTVQLLNIKREAINGSTAETWHQVIPGERRTNCQGCHAHWKPDTVQFEETFAATDEYTPLRLTKIKTVVYDRDIAPVDNTIPKEAWKVGYDTYKSSLTSLDDNPAHSEEFKLLLREWQDTGFMGAGKIKVNGVLTTITPEMNLGPYADTMEPTLCITVLSNKVVIGAIDPWSGLNKATFKITHNDVDITNQFVENPDDYTWTYSGVLANGVIKATISDNHNNNTTISQNVTIDNSSLIAQLEAEKLAKEQSLVVLNEEKIQKELEISTINSQIQTLEEQIQQIQEMIDSLQ